MKLFMMPQTVPKRPTKGAVAPMVASTPVPTLSRRPACASMRAEVRGDALEEARGRRRGGAPRSRRRPRARAARTISAAGPRRPASAPSAARGRGARGRRRGSRRRRRAARRNSRLLAKSTVQVTSEATARPIITAFTTTSAAGTCPTGERSRRAAVGRSPRRRASRALRPRRARGGAGACAARARRQRRRRLRSRPGRRGRPTAARRERRDRPARRRAGGGRVPGRGGERRGLGGRHGRAPASCAPAADAMSKAAARDAASALPVVSPRPGGDALEGLVP